VPYVFGNEVRSTIATGNDWERGTDTSIVLTSAANFDADGGYIRIGDLTSFAIMEYTGKTSNTLTGLTAATLGVVVSTGDETKTWPEDTAVERTNAAEDMQDIVDYVDDRTRYLRGTVATPKTFYDDVDHEICLWPATDAAITITKIQITCDADPTTELDIDLKWADAFIGLANAAVIDVCDTTNGAFLATSGFDDATVASGKCIYWSLGAAPDADTTQFSFTIEYTYD
jgi:hypothetical protein